ncbi:stalk domain-containing protein [Paenibacillus illinoisensis]|uniref:stalk domain-containing protein n=1 Tax=Paenibacillus illinoisensis TaxID=59845 RepID=UPI000FDB3801|nr:stalk domain-containing protein [Paenibacillus illinoisensis]
MKKSILIIIAIFLFITSANSISAEAHQNSIEVKIDEQAFQLVEGTDYIISAGHILVSPVYISSVLDFAVPGKGIWWDNKAKSVIFAYVDIDDYPKPRLTFKVGESHFTEFDKEIELKIKTVMVEGRVYLPLRAISEAYGKEIHWESNNGQNMVLITTQNQQ